MSSSVNTGQQNLHDDGNPIISAERLDSVSVSSDPVRLDAQIAGMGENEIRTTEGEEDLIKEEEGREQAVALRPPVGDLIDTTAWDSYEDYSDAIQRDPMYVGRSYNDILDGCFHDPIDSSSGVDVKEEPNEHLSPDFPSSGVDIEDVSNHDVSLAGVRLRREDGPARQICCKLCRPPLSTVDFPQKKEGRISFAEEDRQLEMEIRNRRQLQASKLALQEFEKSIGLVKEE